MKIKCIDCRKEGKKINCNCCSNAISVCREHEKEYFLITESEIVCIECQNAGMGGEKRYISRRN